MNKSLSTLYTAAMAFDNGRAKRSWTHGGPDDWEHMSNAEICVWGAAREAARRAQVDECVKPIIEGLELAQHFECKERCQRERNIHSAYCLSWSDALAALAKAVEECK